MAELRKVQRGERFRPSATWQHATVDAIRYVRQLQSSGGEGAGYAVRQADIVFVKNATGQALWRFNPVGIEWTWPTPAEDLATFQNRPLLYGVVPQRPRHLGRYAVLLEPAQPDAIVPAVLDGVTVVRLVVHDPCDGFADIIDGDPWKLYTRSRPDQGSAVILWKESGIGMKWGVVRIAHSPAGPCTTTTCPPCPGQCRWQCTQFGWSKLIDTCNAGCACIPPQEWCLPTNYGALADGQCCGTTSQAPTTTSTTGPPTTTSQAPTTTTTQAPTTTSWTP